VNRINFLQPVRIGDKLQYTSRITYTGRTSMCVEVSIERISRDRVTRALSNTCVFTFVNVDARMTPRPVPPVYPTTYAEDARYLDAYRRHHRFLTRRETRQGVARRDMPEYVEP
jgi:acyl-CoA hydrolase